MPEVRVLKALAAATCAVLVALGASACSKHDGAAAPPGASASAQPVPLVVRFSSVQGRLPSAARSRVRTEVGAVVERWWQAAYLSTGGGDPFARSFTHGAARLAKRDADLMSNAAIAKRISSVAPTRREVDLDVLAVKGVARGVTARLRLTYTTSGALRQGCFVGGTASLVPTSSGWRIFGYDVTHTCHPRKAGS